MSLKTHISQNHYFFTLKLWKIQKVLTVALCRPTREIGLSGTLESRIFMKSRHKSGTNTISWNIAGNSVLFYALCMPLSGYYRPKRKLL